VQIYEANLFTTFEHKNTRDGSGTFLCGWTMVDCWNNWCFGRWTLQIEGCEDWERTGL